MINLSRLTSRLFPDRRPEWEKGKRPVNTPTELQH